ncbi:hypothetical protein HZA57_06900 [Candidatus Poribacteria bacterium]|nr:hypothetical protein [Candidatus Poribacteria bacterium]
MTGLPGDKAPPAQRLHAALGPEELAGVVEATTGRDREPGFLVVLGRQAQPPRPEQLKAFAEGLGLDLYSARQRLLLPAPRLLRREEVMREADRWTAWLRALGVAAFTVPEVVLPAFQVRPLRCIAIMPEALGCEMQDGSLREVAYTEILCIVHGPVSMRQTAEHTSHDILMGDVRAGHEVVRARTEEFIDLHLVSEPAALRIMQDDFDFHRTFPGRQSASGVQVRELLALLTSSSPGAQVFGEFKQVAAALGQSHEVLAQSRYLGYQLLSRGSFNLQLKTTKVIETDERGAFDLYSLLTRLQLLRG